MEKTFVKQVNIERTRKRIFSLFTVCIIDYEKISPTPDLEIRHDSRSRFIEKDRTGESSYIIDIHV
jgi:hypothetical protein